MATEQAGLGRTSGATTRSSKLCAATRWATRCARRQFEVARDLAKIGKPVDKGEWDHDAAHRERLLRSADEQRELPCRLLAAAVFQRQGGRRGQLRRHGAHHRARVDARLRRRGPAVRQGRQPEGLVDRRTTRKFNERADCVAEQYAPSRPWRTFKSTAG